MNSTLLDIDFSFRQSTAHLERIIAVQSELASASFDLNNFMHVIATRLIELTPATGGVIELVEGDEMVYRAVGGSVAPHYGMRIKRDGSLSGLCVTTGEIILCNDTASDPRVDAEACRKVGAASMVVVPLFQQGKIIGVLKVLSTQTHVFDKQDVQTLQLMAGLLGGALGQQLAYDATQKLLEDHTQMLHIMQSEIIRREEVEQQLLHVSRHDPLTGLPNRTLFYDRLNLAIARAAQDKTGLALLYIDVDHFKEVNDLYGHAAGDEYLCDFAAHVKESIRSSDTLARLGGDEFALIAEGLGDENEVIALAKKMMATIAQKCQSEGRILPASASIGIALLKTEEETPESLIKRADSAMYEAKRAGRDQYVLG